MHGVLAALHYSGIVARGSTAAATQFGGMMDSLLKWCATRVRPLAGAELVLRAVAGDASFRRYFRLVGCLPTRIAVHAPPDKERNLEFIHIAAILRAAGVQAPEVLAHEPGEGFLLLSDLGDTLLLGALGEDTVEALYRTALDTLLAIQGAAIQHGGWRAPDYSAALLEQEMALFPEWYLQGLLGLEPDAGERRMLRDLFECLGASALEQPQVLVHRDYHSRNLMLQPDGTLGVIDFQDAVRGPLTYDLVSLLRDCYIEWPAARVQAWAREYAGRASAAGLMAPVEAATFRRWFDWMGLQRHIKVLGIFARLWLRDGKRGYLADLPLVMRYTLGVAEAYPELGEFAGWFRARVLPLAAAQDWYRPR
ncbi:MAG: phosphotransferase [Gammaproteobacteria bacterium]|nr:phosphotransferase [Gammaproteobacteria bacterium]MBK7519608.1 phosphotransferase [Gammaproteobacteria bacterium]MBK7731153.1 phosphotransferase [Gammaproteobacteria bacterium]MBK8307090.1 phosphotransferase [Gammaproteobacteria bacterium]MBP6228469.1 phosphotransferase [Pseudomonadales bacterium]